MWDLTTCGIPDQGLNLYPLHWKCSLNHWTTREVPCVAVFADDHTQKPRASRAVDLYLELYWEKRELSATYSAAQPCGSLACRFTLSCFLCLCTSWSFISAVVYMPVSLSSLLQSIFLASLNRVSKPAYPSLEAMSLYSATGRIRKKCSFSVQHTWPVKLLLFHPSAMSHSSDLMDCSSSLRGILQAGILEWAAIFFDWISDKLAV